MWLLLAFAQVTFSHDVAPILYKHCVAGHRPGEVAPFALLSYRDAAKRAGLIATVTARRYMPPWLPAHGYGAFAGERRLSSAEIAILRQWADSGAPEGDAASMPKLPRFPDGWELSRPYSALSVARPFSIPADGPDLYRCFALPAPSASDRYIRAIEFRPGNRKVVHHAIFFQDTSGTARARDKGEGYYCSGAPGFLPVRGLGGWAPGGFPIRLPSDMPEVLYRGGDIVEQIHFHPTGKPERDQAEIGLYFTNHKPERHAKTYIPLGSTDIDIPPGDRAYTVRDHFTMPVDTEALGIIPHAHYVCRDMKGAAHPPGRNAAAADLDSQRGFRLAGAIPLRRAPEAARRHTPRDGVYLRQLG